MKSILYPLVLSAGLLLVLVLLLPTTSRRKDSPALLVYCAAVLRVPMEAITLEYKDKHRVQLQLQFGGSGTLLGNVEVSGVGDLYIAADGAFAARAIEKGLVREALPIALIRPVILVQAGNPKGIRGLEDLLRTDLRASLANPDATSIGSVTRRMLEERGQWGLAEAAIQQRGVFKPTVSDVANDVKLGGVDLGVVWDVTARQYPELETLSIPGAEDVVEEVVASTLKCSREPELAEDFLRFLAGPDGGRILAAHGFSAPMGGQPTN